MIPTLKRLWRNWTRLSPIVGLMFVNTLIQKNIPETSDDQPWYEQAGFTIMMMGFLILIMVEGKKSVAKLTLEQIIANRHVPLLQTLLQNLTPTQKLNFLQPGYFSSHTPLMGAAQHGYTDIIHILLDGLDDEAILSLLNQTNDQDQTAIMLAFENEHGDTVEALQEYGAQLPEHNFHIINPELSQYINTLNNREISYNNQINKLLITLHNLNTIKLDTPSHQEREALTKIGEENFNCVISHDIMNVPVLLNERHHYDYTSLHTLWRDPITRQPLVRADIQADRETQKEMDQFVEKCEQFIVKLA